MKNKEIEDLEQALFRTKIFVFGVVIIIPLIYGYYLGFDSQQSLSRNGAHWGTFGDFVGGILNPIVALCAFYWLTQSVLIQKTELSTTQTILAETEKTQRYQRFENSFFSLLEQMNSVFIQLDTPDMSRTSTTNNCQVANRSKLSKLHREVFNVNSTVSISIMYIRLRDNSADTNHYLSITTVYIKE